MQGNIAWGSVLGERCIVFQLLFRNVKIRIMVGRGECTTTQCISTIRLTNTHVNVNLKVENYFSKILDGIMLTGGFCLV